MAFLARSCSDHSCSLEADGREGRLWTRVDGNSRSLPGEPGQAWVLGEALTGLPVNWFAEGWVEAGADDRLERRTILASTAASGTSVTLTLNHPFTWAAVDDAVVLVPGCDGRQTTCLNKFDNFLNFGGHRFALANLTLKAIEVPAASGGKK